MCANIFAQKIQSGIDEPIGKYISNINRKCHIALHRCVSFSIPASNVWGCLFPYNFPPSSVFWICKNLMGKKWIYHCNYNLYSLLLMKSNVLLYTKKPSVFLFSEKGHFFLLGYWSPWFIETNYVLEYLTLCEVSCSFFSS